MLHPGITTVRLRSNPRKPALATRSADIVPVRKNLAWSMPDAWPNSVRVGPGHRQLTCSPEPATRSSSASASVKCRTNAFVA